MKKILFYTAIIVIIPLAISCRNSSRKNMPKSEISEQALSNERLIPIGKDIITEVVVRPDTMGDPWEVEKVKGFDGREVFADLFKKIYKGKLTVYDCFSEDALDRSSVRHIENEIGNDFSRIGKIQFLEDWYFNPLTNRITKKVKSVTFAYEITREGGLPSGYKGIFRLKTE